MQCSGRVVRRVQSATLRYTGAQGVARDAQQAAQLCERAIREGNDVRAMNNLGVLLKNGAQGVAVDAPRALELFEPTIRKEIHVGAMLELSWLLREGANGVDADELRSRVPFYQTRFYFSSNVRQLKTIGSAGTIYENEA